jgi:hypothetical protein
LTLPAALVQALHLPWQNVVRGTLADGSTCLLELYEAALLWDRQWRPVLAVQSESAALVGMELLSGFALNMEIRPKGKLTIKRLSQKRGSASEEP